MVLRFDLIKRLEDRLGAYVEKLADSGNTTAKRVLVSQNVIGLYHFRMDCVGFVG